MNIVQNKDQANVKNNKAPIILVASAFLATCISIYYLNYHIQTMDPYPLKLKGASVYVASIIIAFSSSYFLTILWNERANLADNFSPSISRFTFCAVIALLTPVGNLLWIPIPLGALVISNLAHGHLDESIVLSVLLFFAPAYGVACLTTVETDSPWRLISPSLLYLVGIFTAATLFTGISYI